MKEIVLEVINHYGVLPQLKYFQSEVFELNEAIIKLEQFYIDVANEDDCYEKFIKNEIHLKKEHVAEEIADVSFMLRQFQEFYEITDEEINDIELFKGTRQLERIKKEENKLEKEEE